MSRRTAEESAAAKTLDVKPVPQASWPDGASLDEEQVRALHSSSHGDVGFVLGWHELPGGLVVVRVWHGALEAEGDVKLALGDHRLPMVRRCGWLYEAVLEGASGLSEDQRCYWVEVARGGEAPQRLYDAYGHIAPLVSEEEVKQLHDGFLQNIGDVLGCHCARLRGVFGLRFAVWAPKAELVRVVGDFNGWDGRAHPMRRRCVEGGFTGVWELFVPFGIEYEAVPQGSKYMYRIKGCQGADTDKIDPFGQRFEVPPAHATVATGCNDGLGADSFCWSDGAWMKERGQARAEDKFRRQPMAIYEVHLPSWRRTMEGDLLGFRDLAPPLVQHMQALHFNWIELLPIAHHPFDGSWGYQVTGHYAVYSSLGSPDDFKFFVDEMHQAGIGVIMDYVPAHFCKDSWGLVDFDGAATFEYEDPREGEHAEWGTRVFNFKKHEVRAYLLGAPLFWIDKYHIDGFRVDAVSAMLYRNFNRKDGEWIPNEHGGDSNLEAVSLLRELTQRVKELWPGVVMIAEESTSWSGVTRGMDEPNGLGFDFKWDLGWMNDTLSYLAAPARERPGKHEKLTFRGLYMQHEKWVLPLSHDEVVSGKGSLLDKMSYLDHPEFFDKAQLLKALFGFQVASPGRPLLFMGGEYAQGREWNYRQSLDWHEGEEETRSKVCTWVSDLIGTYVAHPPLHAGDDEPHGAEDFGIARSFEWTEVDNREACTVAFMRTWQDELPVFVICNFSPNLYQSYGFGLPYGGTWKVLLNSDDWRYGGRGCGPGNHAELETTPEGRYGWPACLKVDVPANSCLFLLGPKIPPRKLPDAEDVAEPEVTEKAS